MKYFFTQIVWNIKFYKMKKIFENDLKFSED